MAMWICKVGSSTMGQYRLTLPVGLIALKKWQGVRYVVLEESPEGVTIRRFKDGESLKSYEKVDSAISD